MQKTFADAGENQSLPGKSWQGFDASNYESMFENAYFLALLQANTRGKIAGVIRIQKCRQTGN
jgi:hypothetical protein